MKPFTAAARSPGPFVYFVDCEGFTKIGFTEQSPLQRLYALQGSGPFRLKLWGLIPGPRSLECEMHAKHKAIPRAHVHGEWFDLQSAGIRDLAEQHIKSLGGLIDRKGCFVIGPLPRRLPTSPAQIRLGVAHKPAISPQDLQTIRDWEATA